MTPLAESLLPPGYAIALREHRIASMRIRLFQIESPNALSDSIDARSFGEDERFPYWAEVWPSGVALAQFVLRRGVEPGVEAVELGCGLGLVGVAAALAGARVTFTDFEPDALAFARANHRLNVGPPGRTRLVDWRHPPGDLAAPLVLAADVLYERRFLEPFRNTLRQVVGPGGVAYVAEPGRDIALGAVERLDCEGFERELHLEEVEVAGRLHGVWIHELRRISSPPSPQGESSFVRKEPSGRSTRGAEEERRGMALSQTDVRCLPSPRAPRHGNVPGRSVPGGPARQEEVEPWLEFWSWTTTQKSAGLSARPCR